MTNKEKYQKLDDAVKAYHREHYNGSFIKWLDEEAEPAEPAKDEASPTPDDLASGLGLAGIFSALLDGKSHKCECGCDMADGRQTHVKIEIDVGGKSPAVQDEEPLPCPFCGSEACVRKPDKFCVAKVYCLECSCSMHYANIAAYGDTLAEAVRNWNTRAAR